MLLELLHLPWCVTFAVSCVLKPNRAPLRGLAVAGMEAARLLADTFALATGLQADIYVGTTGAGRSWPFRRVSACDPVVCLCLPASAFGEPDHVSARARVTCVRKQPGLHCGVLY